MKPQINADNSDQKEESRSSHKTQSCPLLLPSASWFLVLIRIYPRKSAANFLTAHTQRCCA
jgi:hypothetical protein